MFSRKAEQLLRKLRLKRERQTEPYPKVDEHPFRFHVSVTIDISLGNIRNCANSVGFRGSVPLFPDFCQLSVPEVGVCGVYSESP